MGCRANSVMSEIAILRQLIATASLFYAGCSTPYGLGCDTLSG